MKLSWVSLALALLTFFSAGAQSILTGKTLDARTGAPVPFVTISLPKAHTGTTSDILGEFQLKVNASDTLVVSSIGYASQRIPLTDVTGKLVIELTEMIAELPEIAIHPEDNPAHRIIRKATANRAKNDPENLHSFRYRAYHKFYASLDGEPEPDSVNKRSNLADSTYFFLNESVTEKKFLAPNFSKETVIGNKMSGVDDPFFVVLATDFQPFTFYTDHITLLDRNYRNPISPGSLTRYHFTLTDTVYQEADTVFIIQFEPLPGKNFDALSGQLHINSNGYALENVIAEPADKHVMIRIAIQQQYVFISGHWFPRQLNTVFTLTQYKIGKRRLQYQHSTFVNQPEINPELAKNEFDFINTKFMRDANRKDSAFWNNERAIPLSRKEKNTYHLYDTLSPRYKKMVNNMINAGESLMVGKLRVGKFYLPYEHMLRFNDYEGIRIGLGVQTSELLSEIFTWEVYAAYGFNDKGFKYGGSWQINLKKANDFFLKLSYQQDVAEPGNPNFLAAPFMATGGQTVRNWFTSRMDSIQQSKIQLHIRPLRFTQLAFFVQHKKYNPAYPYQYTDPKSGENMHAFTIAEAGIQLRFAWHEEYAQIGSGRLVTSFAFPQINLSVSKGFKALNGQYDFIKADLKIDHQFLTRGLGKTTLQFNAGIIHNAVPYSLLANGKGSKTEDPFLNILVVPNQFQTMGLYEFASDQYAYILIKHNAGRLTGTNSRYFRPELELVHNMGIGRLQESEPHNTISFNTLEQGYIESGLLISNILRFNYVNIAHYGIGGGVFYRYGPYRFPEVSDNISAKVMLTFSF